MPAEESHPYWTRKFALSSVPKTTPTPLVPPLFRPAPGPDGAAGPGPAAAIVLNAEDGAADTLHARLRAAGADFERVHLLDRSDDEPWLRLPPAVAALDEAVARSGARLVVLDPILGF